MHENESPHSGSAQMWMHKVASASTAAQFAIQSEHISLIIMFQRIYCLYFNINVCAPNSIAYDYD